jgi:quinol monooxygenase YgiN
MLIAHVTFSVLPENRTLAIDALTQEVRAVRAMKGCKAFTPFLDPTSERDVGVLHEWDTAEEFDAYIKSDIFMTMGKVLRPIMVAPPVSKRFDATSIMA